jgi:glucose-1-phosphate thymidylyltransferase
MKAIIPTGGRGTRMRPLTFSQNKHFIPIANKPLIYYPIETVANAGIKDIAITYNPNGLDEAKEFLGDGSKWGLNFTYILQEEPKGLANIFQVCQDYLEGKPFVMHLGDNIFVDGINTLVENFIKEKPEGLVAMVHHKENMRLGVPYFDKYGNLIKYVEKPTDPPHDFAIPGIYFFGPQVFECFKNEDGIKPSSRGEYEISAPYQWLIDHGFKVLVQEYKGKWMDPGKFDDWLDANEYLLKYSLKAKIESKVDKSSRLEGVVVIGRGCRIIKSEIKGPTILGDNITVENSKIGPLTSIGDNCQIINSQIENSVLMSGVKIVMINKHPIVESLIGTDTEVVGANGKGPTTSLFVGEKCKIKV